MTEPVAIRFRNPGALNKGSWMPKYPGFKGSQVTTPGNDTAIFETNEHGVAAWWELLRRYRDNSGDTTVEAIIGHYGGKGQDYSEYVQTVVQRTGFRADQEINLNNDKQLMKFARAMFRVEAGIETPLTDAQLAAGFKRGRNQAPGSPVEALKAPGPAQDTPGRQGLLAMLIQLLRKQ